MSTVRSTLTRSWPARAMTAGMFAGMVGASAMAFPAAASAAPVGTSLAACAESGLAAHLVAEGDTWFGIAERARISIRSLVETNEASRDRIIHPGDVVCLPPGATPSSSCSPSNAPTYTVTSGDTWWTSRHGQVSRCRSCSQRTAPLANAPSILATRSACRLGHRCRRLAPRQEQRRPGRRRPGQRRRPLGRRGSRRSRCVDRAGSATTGVTPVVAGAATKAPTSSPRPAATCTPSPTGSSPVGHGTSPAFAREMHGG
jgi:hypothetical protein